MFKSLIKNEFMNSVIENANSELLLESVIEDIEAIEIFDMCNKSPAEMAVIFKNVMNFFEFNVVEYRPLNVFTRAIGYYDKNDKTTIYVNVYKFYKLNLFDAVSFLFHEVGHAASFIHAGCDCNHGNNSPIGKENTFQYSLNRFVLNFFGVYKKKKLSRFQRVKLWIYSFFS